MAYPHPFFDLSSTYLPQSIKSLFRWLRHYFLTNGFFNTVVSKLAEYPITNLVFEAKSPETARKWSEYFEDHLRYRLFQVEVGLDYFVYGNAFVSVRHPFVKFLTCKYCKHSASARSIREKWTFTGFDFRLTCPACGQIGPAEVRDQSTPSAGGVRLFRWSPEEVTVQYNPFSGTKTYYFDVPAHLRNDIILGRRHIVEEIPQAFIEAARKGHAVILPSESVYHMARPSISGFDRGWGIPLLLPVLKEGFQMQVLKKANECLAPDTLLDTPRGLVPAKDVQVGDALKDHLGGLTHVVARRNRPVETDQGQFAVEIAISGMRELSSTFSDNHPLYVLRRNQKRRRTDTQDRQPSSEMVEHPDLYDFVWLPAGEVQVGDYVGYPTYRKEEPQTLELGLLLADYPHTDTHVYSAVSEETAHLFEQGEHGAYVPHTSSGRTVKNHLKGGTAPKRIKRQMPVTEDLAYIAGWYLGDGSKGSRHLTFSMGPDDDGVDLEQALIEVTGVRPSRHPDPKSRGWRLDLCETLFAEVLSRWISGVAATKRIPQEIMEAPRGVVLKFLEGYLEADGHYSKSSDAVSVCCANQGLTYQVWQLLLSLGCISTLSSSESYATTITDALGRTSEVSAGRPVHHLTVSGQSGRRLRALLADQPAEEVKIGKSGFFFGEHFAGRVSSVERVDCPEVITFEVESPNTFCVAGMATHNCVLMEHLIPLRVLFPQPAAGSADPFTAVPLALWKEQVASEIGRFRWDPNYIPILPLPIGQQTIGGEGKALMLDQQIQALAEQIVVQIGVPKEIIFGGAGWTGTNVSMRSVENFFLGYLTEHHGLFRFICRQLCVALNWTEAEGRFKPFRMAEDLQRKQLLAQLAQTGKPISNTTLFGEFDLDVTDEAALIIRETPGIIEAQRAFQTASTKLANDMAALQGKAQAKMQQEMAAAQQPGAAPGEMGQPQAGQPADPSQMAAQAAQPAAPAAPAAGYAPSADEAFNATVGSPLSAKSQGVPISQVAQSYAQTLSSMPPEQAKVFLENIKNTMPEIYNMVVQLLAQMQAGAAGAQGAAPAAGGTPDALQLPATPGVNMTPMPEQRPPRRAGS